MNRTECSEYGELLDLWWDETIVIFWSDYSKEEQQCDKNDQENSNQLKWEHDKF